MKIEDGKGYNGAASVSESRRLNVSSKVSPRTFYISRDDEQAFHSIMPTFNGVAGNYVFYIKNTSTSKYMYIEDFKLNSAQGVLWKLWRVSGTAAGGTLITPANLNLSSSIPAQAICMGGGATITGLTLVQQLSTLRTAGTIGGTVKMEFCGALVLPPNEAIMVEYDTGTTGLCEVECHHWFEDICRKN